MIWLVPFLVVGFLALTPVVGAETGRGFFGSDWTVYRNERFGFSLSYPADVFEVERTSEAETARCSLACGVTGVFWSVLLPIATATP